ncbi:MAG: type II toxin-antitoxin system RnlB family antitoxin [Oscillospiraceae bacterium]|nr:type II toxin-antitoxin system RnlB family antitoxin [Oscillospiraceae bacterium]
MNNYYRIKLSDSQYDFLIIATTHENPINSFLNNYISFIENGKVAFDLTVINGKSFNRYAFAEVNNHKIIISSIIVSSTADETITNESNKFFSENIDIIEQSVLPKALKFLLINELQKK